MTRQPPRAPRPSSRADTSAQRSAAGLRLVPKAATGQPGTYASRIIPMLKRVAQRRASTEVRLGLYRWLGVGVGVVAVQLGLDRALNLDWEVRLAFRCLEAIGAVILFLRWVIVPGLRRWTPEQAALVVQRHFPSLGSRLISVVQLDNSQPSGAGSLAGLLDPLARRLVADLRHCRLAIITPQAHLWRLATLSGLLGLALAATLYQTSPGSLLLLQRYALGRVALPTQTRIIATTGDLTPARGQTVLLEATVEGILPPTGSVVLQYESGTAIRRTVNPGLSTPDRYTLELPNVIAPFTYRFEIGDGTSERFRVRPLESPALQEILWRVQPPAYTGLPATTLPAGPLRLLVGSRVTLEARADRPLAGASLSWHGGAEERVEPIEVTANSRDRLTTTFDVPTSGLTGLAITLASENGSSSGSDVIYPVSLLPDRPPTIDITEPPLTARTMVNNATLAVRADLQDDFGLAQATLILSYQHTDSTSTPTEFRQSLDLGTVTQRGIGTSNAPTRANATAAVSLASLRPTLRPGDTLNWWIEATDNNTATGPSTTLSPARTIQIVTLAEKQRELLELLDETSTRIEDLTRQQLDIRTNLDPTRR